MTKNIAFKNVNQGYALVTETLPWLRSAVPAGWNRGDQGDDGGGCRAVVWQALRMPR